MRKQDFIFLAISFSTMILGIMMPFLAQPLEWVPRVTLLVLFWISFLSIDCAEAWRNLKQFPGAVVLLTVVKLLLMPVACWGIFRLIMPEFALGAAIMGGASSAVAAPFLALMLQADFVLVLVGLVTSSLLLPLVLPFVLAMLPGTAGPVVFPVGDMMLSLSVTIMIPFCVGQFMRRAAPKITERLLFYRMGIFMTCMGLAGLAIFSRYSPVLLQSPRVMLDAVGAAVLVCLVIFCLATVITWWMPPDKQMAVVISCASVNNILMLILSMEFFSLPEMLMAAMYIVPFFCAVFLYRLLAYVRRHDRR